MNSSKMQKSFQEQIVFGLFLKRLKVYGTATGAQMQVTVEHSELLQAEPPGPVL